MPREATCGHRGAATSLGTAGADSRMEEGEGDSGVHRPASRLRTERVARRGALRELARRPQQRRSDVVGRSEEHTSELQSLMRISYAVSCLKKKQQTKDIHNKNVA